MRKSIAGIAALLLGFGLAVSACEQSGEDQAPLEPRADQLPERPQDDLAPPSEQQPAAP
jgi:hypothetical protein